VKIAEAYLETLRDKHERAKDNTKQTDNANTRQSVFAQCGGILILYFHYRRTEVNPLNNLKINTVILL